MNHVEGSKGSFQKDVDSSGPKTLVRSAAGSIENIRVASPCTASWNKMEGDDRVRFCGSCQKSVYNLSAMNRLEAEQLVAEKEGRLCVRYYQRHDGTVLTSDCPVGLLAVRRKIALRLSMVIALLFSLWGLLLGRGWSPGPTMGKMAEDSGQGQTQDVCSVVKRANTQPTMGTPLAPIMGAIARATPTVKISPRRKVFTSHRVVKPPIFMGRVAIQYPQTTTNPASADISHQAPQEDHSKRETAAQPSQLHQIKIGH